MAEFSPETKVLYYSPYCPRGATADSILWPFWVFRVVGPKVENRELNFLEKALLGLLKVGVLHILEIANSLNMHKDLIAHIFRDLGERELISRDGNLTSKGEKALDNCLVTTEEQAVLFIFQDVYSGKLLPRVADSLNFAETELNEQNFPVLIVGDPGNPKRRPAFLEMPQGKTTFEKPGSQEIYEAIFRHGRAETRKGRESNSYTTYQEESWSEVSIIAGNNISYIDKQPTPFFLTAEIYLQENAVASADWRVTDPFGLGDCPPMKKIVEERLPLSPNLRQRIEKLSRKAEGRVVKDYQDWGEVIREKADNTLKVVFAGLNFSIYHEYLLEVECAFEELDKSQREERKIRTFLLAVRRTLEILFRSTLDGNHLVDELSGLSSEDFSLNRQRIKSAARSIGFQLPIPSSLERVKYGNIKAVAEFKEYSKLHAVITLNLLVADWKQDHVFRQFARKDIEFLDKQDSVIRMCGENLHAGAFNYQEASFEEIRENLYDWVRTIIECSGNGEYGEING